QTPPPSPAPQAGQEKPWYKKPDFLITTTLAIVTVIIAGFATAAAMKSGSADDESATREREKEEEEAAAASGPPVSFTIGSGGGSGFHALKVPIASLRNMPEESGPDEGWSNWLLENDAREVEWTHKRITIRALHRGVTVQGMRVSGLNCLNSATRGTLVLPRHSQAAPGEMDKRPEIVFNLAEQGLPARELLAGFSGEKTDDGWLPGGNEWNLGHPFFKGTSVVFDKPGDTKTFDLYFLAGQKDCIFGLDVNVTGAESDTWIPVTTGPRSVKVALAGRAGSYQSGIMGWGEGYRLAIPKLDSPVVVRLGKS
ncbi:hypothetical protein, partial [Streptomyces sp. NPDC002889]|uniref:hypothetical protein n=1 Tax=Streptomyces sp. NPDC002889 TaxID=3364669 RepID=UPI0036A02E63